MHRLRPVTDPISVVMTPTASYLHGRQSEFLGDLTGAIRWRLFHPDSPVLRKRINAVTSALQASAALHCPLAIGKAVPTER